MTHYVALLRGISPANPNMKNEKLREVFESLGFKNVQTVISSGNVLFDSGETNSRKLEQVIEDAFPVKLGFSSRTIIRSRQDLEKVAAKKYFKEFDDESKARLNVAFLKNKPEQTIKLPYQGNGFTVLALDGQEIYSLVDLTGKTPDVMRWLEKEFTKNITTRTWKTVHRILEKFS